MSAQRTTVALRKESVDRNSWAARARVAQYVALRKESVDRNVINADFAILCAKSLSARRAWIEIPPHPRQRPARGVALRKESVDRNALTSSLIRRSFCRSPQGERG